MRLLFTRALHVIVVVALIVALIVALLAFALASPRLYAIVSGLAVLLIVACGVAFLLRIHRVGALSPGVLLGLAMNVVGLGVIALTLFVTRGLLGLRPPIDNTMADIVETALTGAGMVLMLFGWLVAMKAAVKASADAGASSGGA